MSLSFCPSHPRDATRCSDPFLPFIAFQSLKATRNFSISDWSKNFEVVFQDEEGQFWNFIFIFLNSPPHSYPPPYPLSTKKETTPLTHAHAHTSFFFQGKKVMSQDEKSGVYWPDGMVELVEHRHTGTWGESCKSVNQEGQVAFVEPGEMSIS